MTTEALLTVLKKHSFADEFEPYHLEKLRSLAREVEFKKDQIIFRQGEDCPDFYLIADGRVGLEVEVPGSTLRLHTLSAGDELGWSVLLGDQGRHFQARALEPVHAFAFDGGQLREACKRDPSFGYALMHRLLIIVAARLEYTRGQLMDSYTPIGARAGA